MMLDQDHAMVRDAIRTFVRDAILPRAAAWDRDRLFRSWKPRANSSGTRPR